MTLQNKNAVIYGAGGSLGGAVARAFARAGARVFLTGHRMESIRAVADEIIGFGGKAEVAIVDGFDEGGVAAHLDKVRQQAGSVDISYNGVDIPVIQNIPLTEISIDDYVAPVMLTARTRFLTAKAAAKVMMEQRSGVILSITATPGGIGYPYTGGFAAANAAVESLARNLASEVGGYGVRVVNIRSGGSPDSAVFKNAIERHPDVMAAMLREMEEDTMLKKLPPMADIANTAVFLASDMAASITGVTVDVTSGTTAALNYRVKLATFSQETSSR
ncbi:MAG TPA: SDR family oxidoreductase [Puia sp.]|jgi:NAD(P)-dependent dehydrogenase (short-subunit alcohol dehydrogenase family)|nr:SDR family oxidoreductase [Puia sp.]